MSYRLLLNSAALLCAAAAIAGAAEKKLPIDETSNDVLAISVSEPLDKEQIKQELGAELTDPDIVAIRMTARPVSDKPVRLSLDDFVLISGKDGQRSMPFAPGQLAGADSLAVTSNGVRRGLGDHSHRPSVFGGFGIGGVGSGGGTPPPTDTKMEESRAKEDNPLLAALNAKVLPEKEIKEPVTGLLFFQIVGKVKPKDLELRYKGPAGQMALRFREK